MPFFYDSAPHSIEDKRVAQAGNFLVAILVVLDESGCAEDRTRRRTCLSEFYKNMTPKAFRQRQALLLAERQRDQRIERLREVQAAYERSRPNAGLATLGSFQYWNRTHGRMASIEDDAWIAPAR